MQGAPAPLAAMHIMRKLCCMLGSGRRPLCPPHKALAPALAGVRSAHRARAQRLHVAARSAGSGGNVIDRPSLLPGQDTR